MQPRDGPETSVLNHFTTPNKQKTEELISTATEAYDHANVNIPLLKFASKNALFC